MECYLIKKIFLNLALDLPLILLKKKIEKRKKHIINNENL